MNCPSCYLSLSREGEWSTIQAIISRILDHSRSKLEQRLGLQLNTLPKTISHKHLKLHPVYRTLYSRVIEGPDLPVPPWLPLLEMSSFIMHLKIEFLGSDFSDVRSSEPFDEILASEAAQALREGLGPIDMDGFSMLADPELVQLDPQAEDTFRLDRQL
jgi:hypothetical protein